ncbi:hypothetical protein AB0M38_05825 [Streptomyces sp. NPDC051742]|uniref:hypothetical protein n=1 Tax=unclassified Streptomyces TaxID=2593676 RepID=UPI003419E6A5
MVRTRLKLAATLTVVVLALTGFHTGHGSSSGGSGGGSGKSKSGKSRSDDSGGGCSSDEKSNDDYSGSGSGSDSSGGSGGQTTYAPTPTATSTADVHVSVVDCVDPARKKRKGKPARKADLTATVKVTSNADTEKTFRIVVVFKGASGGAVDQVSTDVTVERRGTRTVEVEMARPENVGQVKECWAYDMGVEPGATASTATPSPTSS